MQPTEEHRPYDEEAHQKAVEYRRPDMEAAVALRKDGYSYEEIADKIAGSWPWLVYRWCNPTKSNEEIKRWVEKHYPEGGEARELAMDRCSYLVKARRAREGNHAH